MAPSKNAASASGLGTVFDSFESHCSSIRTSTHLVILQILRGNYPGYHVTSTGTDEFDFTGFAAAGKATLSFAANDDRSDDLFETVRSYAAPRRRLDRKPGSLSDEVMFGRFEFTHKETDFILFQATWCDSCWGGKSKYWYILAPKEGATIEQGHHSIIDAMLLDVAKWTSQVHDEIYVFDDSYWTKSGELWRSVRGASWDDVVMDAKMKQNLIDDVQGFFDNKEIYRKFGVPWKRGIILHGVPGNGKTISIKALMVRQASGGALHVF
jgi:transitional endoplasmic reticulum ATPase